MQLLTAWSTADSTCAHQHSWQVPGNIRRAEHFVAFMRRFVSYLRSRMRVTAVESESPATFLNHVQNTAYIDGGCLLCNCHLRHAAVVMLDTPVLPTPSYHPHSFILPHTLYNPNRQDAALLLRPPEQPAQDTGGEQH